MAPPLILRIIGDASAYLKTAETTIAANDKIAQSASMTGVAYTRSAEAQVAAGTKAIQVQRLQLEQLTAIEAAAVAGSDTQIAASVAVAGATAKLNRSMGITAVSTGTMGKAAQTGERDLGKLTRGALAGSGVFSSLGRSLAFASGAFLAFAATATLIKGSISAALSLASTQRSVEAQLKTSGKTWGQYGDAVQATDLKLSHISGYTNQELLQSFGYLVRVTGNVGTALKLNAVAADVARGRNISLASASIALSKALGGSVTALRRLGIIVPKGVEGMAALDFVAHKFAGQAQASATVADRFHASLVDMEEIIGTELLPTFDRLTTRLGNWLAKANETGRIQRDANKAISLTGDVFHTLGTIIGTVDRITGGFVNTLRLLFAFKFASLVGGWVISLEALAAKWAAVGVAAGGAATAEGAALGAGAGAGAGAAGAGGGIFGLLGGVAAGGALRGQSLASRIGQYTRSGAPPAAAAGLGSRILATAGGVFTLGDIGAEMGGSKKVIDANGASWLNISGPDGKLFTRIFLGYKGDAVISTTLKRTPQAFAPFTPSQFAPTAPTATTPFQSGPGNPFAGLNPLKVWAGYQLTLAEQIAQAKASLTTSTADDVAVSKQIIARINRLIDAGKLSDKALLQALQAEASALGTIQQAAAAKKAKQQAAAQAALTAASSYEIPGNLQLAQAKLEAFGKNTNGVLKKIIAAAQQAIASGGKNWQGMVAAYGVIASAQQQLQQQATSYALPLKLQLRLAVAQAKGTDQTPILLKMRTALQKALKAAKGNLQEQIDIWNQIAGINNQLASQSQSALGKYKLASTNALTSGLNLSARDRALLRARLSQRGPHGTVPTGGVGAFGYQITSGHTVVHTTINLDGRKVAESTTRHQQKKRRRDAPQRRGPFAGQAIG